MRLIAFTVAAAMSIIANADLGQDEIRGVTVTERVKMAHDDTASIQARTPLFVPQIPRVVVPPGSRRPFAGQTGPGFHLPPDPARELKTIPGSAFPGPGMSGLTPADPNLSVGPNHVICTINGRLQFYTKGGAMTFDTDPGTFFSSLGAYYLIFDPRTYYDRETQRYWIMYPAVLTNAFTHSYYLVALSDDSDPNGAWTLWALDSSKNGNTLTTNWSDYPGFGHTKDAVLFTGNMFNAGYAKIRVALKPQFLAGSPVISYTDFWNFTDGTGATAFSLQPARTNGISNVPFLVSDGGTNNLTIYGINNVLTTPTLVKKSLTVAAFSDPPYADQPGLANGLWTVDTRVFDVHCRDNHLFATQNTTSGTQSAVRWYEIDASAMPAGNPTMVQQGSFTATSRDDYFGNIVQNGAGHMGAAYVRSGSAEFITIYRQGRLITDALNTFGAATVVKAGTVTYNVGNQRWGDYNGLVVDGGDDATFWGYQMTPTSATTWATEVFSFTVGSVATLGGNVALDGWAVSPAGISATLEFRTPATTTVVHSYPITLDAGGNYSINPVFIGTFDVTLKISHWLRKTTAKVIASGVNTLNFTLTNGDMFQDNKVDIFDLNTGLTNFATVDPTLDLDGDNVIALPDLNLIFVNFATNGDN